VAEQLEESVTSEVPRMASRLIEYLPAVYQEGDAGPDLLDHFLLAFETILLGSEAEPSPKNKNKEKKPAKNREEATPKILGLEQKIARLHELFNPEATPEKFLPWLASWVALDLRADLPLPRRRKLLANIVPLYEIRGTKKYVEELLKLHCDAVVAVDDRELPRFQIAAHSTLGKDTYVDGGPPYFFRVRLELSATEREVEIQSHLAREVIELAKPAHTVYALEVIRV